MRNSFTSIFFFFFFFFFVQSAYIKDKIDAVILTTGKDSRVFEKSVLSGLEHLIDVDKFYVVTPYPDDLSKTYSFKLGSRVVFVNENIFPFNGYNVSEIMIETVRQKGVYPLDGNSNFERTIWGRIGWFLQQLLKVYAGRILNLQDFVLLDSDIVWFNNISFIQQTNETNRVYYYTTSNQYHAPYISSLRKISGVDLLPNQPYHRSGIVHHIVMVKKVVDQLFQESEALHGGIPFWQVLLNESALEMTCRAPKAGICGGGSTLSEYELYFVYARNKFPETISIRPLLWANGPAPGLLFAPNAKGLESDGPKNNWRGHRQVDIEEAFGLQMEADELQGYDFIGYHSYAKRRYFELLDPDIDALCLPSTGPRFGHMWTNTTCSWDGLNAWKENAKNDPSVPIPTNQQWFGGCGCYMANHQSGP